MLYIVVVTVLAVFGGLVYYVGLRGWQWLSAFFPYGQLRPVYWSIHWLLALAFPLTRFSPARLPIWLWEMLGRAGAFWMGLFAFSLVLVALMDLVRLISRWLHLIPAGPLPVEAIKLLGSVAFLAAMGLSLYGTWRARTPVVTEYAFSIPKAAGARKDLHVVLVSDTHFGSVLGTGRARRLVDLVNSLEPDIILMAGDIVDDDFRAFVQRDMASELRRLNAPLGVYGVLGNHDPYPEDPAAFRAQMERAGIRLLVDEWVLVDNSFYVVGRSDSSLARYTGAPAVPLHEVLAGVDRSLPVLVMDHRPDRLDEAQAEGIDLQVSGHTHKGQIFPGSLITNRVYEVDWGYLKKGSSYFVVSLGYGTWGPPIRIGNAPEVVSIHLTFGQ